jgi:hypothetical protein
VGVYGMISMLGMCGGCAADPRRGYSLATTFPEDVKTVAVPVFKNQSMSPGIEVELTEAIIKEIQRSTSVKVITPGAGTSADATLRGVVTEVNLRRMNVRSGTGLIQELGYQIAVDFDFRDERDGKLLSSRRNFVATDTFIPTTGVGEKIEAGQRGATQRLAKDLVGELRAGW